MSQRTHCVFIIKLKLLAMFIVRLIQNTTLRHNMTGSIIPNVIRTTQQTLRTPTGTLSQVTSCPLPNSYQHLDTAYCFNLQCQATFIHSAWDFLTLLLEAIQSLEISVVLYQLTSRRCDSPKHHKLYTSEHKGATYEANNRGPTRGHARLSVSQ